jgi:hypothetical protein
MKLRSVRECQLRGLLGHRTADFGDAVAYVDDGGLARCVEELSSVRGKKPRAFATNSEGIRLVKVARKKSGVV